MKDTYWNRLQRPSGITWRQLGRRWYGVGKKLYHGDVGGAIEGTGSNLGWMLSDVYKGATTPVKSTRKRQRSWSGPGTRLGGSPTHYISNDRLVRIQNRTPPRAPTLRITANPPFVPRKLARRYNTRGRYVGRFNRKRSRRIPRSSKIGAMIRTEAAGSFDQDKCVYVGHTTGAYEKVFKVVAWAVIRRLAFKMGQNISTFKERITNEFNTATENLGTLITTRNEDNNEDASTSSVVVTPDMTWEDLADAWITNVLTYWTSVNDSAMRLIKLEFRPQTIEATGAAAIVPVAKLNLDTCIVNFSVLSNLKIQNRTLANSGANPEHHDSALDVENNPICGKSYFGTTNGFPVTIGGGRCNKSCISVFNVASSGSPLITPDV